MGESDEIYDDPLQYITTPTAIQITIGVDEKYSEALAEQLISRIDDLIEELKDEFEGILEDSIIGVLDLAEDRGEVENLENPIPSLH